MKHVFVETNFLVDLLRPFPEHKADNLYGRHGRDVELLIPWCSFPEATRTLERIIREDLSFVDRGNKFLARLMNQVPRPDPSFHREVREFLRLGREVRTQALFDHPDRLEDVQRRVTVLAPTPQATHRTLGLFRSKAMTPFDEMILGLVLEEAGRLHAAGNTTLYFCNLNKSDFRPTHENGLQALFDAVGLRYLDSFHVP